MPGDPPATGVGVATMGFGLGPWALFIAFVLGLLWVDLKVLHRNPHKVSAREAGYWTLVLVALALGFAGLIYLRHDRGPEAAVEFLAGYVLEQSLSIDNIFVFVILFASFSVPPIFQHRVLFWGVLGALVMRAVFILGAAALIARFEWVLLVFGAILLITAIRLVFASDDEVDVEAKWAVRLARRVLPVSSRYHGARFFVREAGKLVATPLFVVLFLVETTDVVFAFDSIPAVFGVTRDPFIVFTSNIFAILGLRSLYFVLLGAVDRFHYLKPALSFILAFIGLKMIVEQLPEPLHVHVSIGVSLGVIAATLVVAAVASLLRPLPPSSTTTAALDDAAETTGGPPA